MYSNFFSQASSSRLSLRKKFYFMAGLPRSGSTLLSSILNQNPKFYSGPSSPVLSMMVSIERDLLYNEQYLGFPKPNQAKEVIGSVITHYYSDISQPIIFDKNRAWTDRIPYIEGYIEQEAKIIVPVRKVDEILTSILSMIHRNPFKEGQSKLNFVDDQLVKLNILINDHNRCEYMLSPGGILYQSLNSILEAFNQNFEHKLHFVDYNDLVSNPKEEIRKIYKFLGEEPFEHQFNYITNINKENDIEAYGLSDMHHVRPKLEKVSPLPEQVLPKSIIKIYEENKEKLEFWKNSNVIPKLNS